MCSVPTNISEGSHSVKKYTGLEPWTRSGLNQQPAADRQTIWSVTVSSLSPGVSLISRRNDHQPADSQQSPGSQQSSCWCSQTASFHFHTQAVLDPTFLRERTVIEHCDWSREGILALSLAVLHVKSSQRLWVSELRTGQTPRTRRTCPINIKLHKIT